ncbi:alpha-keto acid decarboxylase family protein [Archangium violaceum]|uniref:alpha-keto acid decarboxylase family protein n=1 Tax=Archangium violaceum TaxID=83451 RepID=UPI0005BA7BAB|nr:thiamine pyrophosphate-dependent enzyme [Archangium violaceum]
MTNATRMTVAGYLKQRLEELELDRLFGVAGNYTAPFLNTILEDKQSPIAITGVPNEICAGYAADGYARLKGIGAVTVTYGVGAFSLLNAVAGSYMELAPVVVINGAPTNKEFLNERISGLVYSHMMDDPNSNLNVYRQVAVSAQRIVNANEAPSQIDAALTACITHRQPVYLEVLEDVWRAPCPAPAGMLSRQQVSITVSDVKSAVLATLNMIQERGKPLFWAGVEIQRQGLQSEFLELLERTGISFTTSVLGKSIVSEDHPGYLGVYAPEGSNSSSGSGSAEVKQLVENAGCLIGLGAWTTGKDTNNQLIQGDGVALAQHGGVTVGARFFPSVMLADYMHGLIDAVKRAPPRFTAYKPEVPKVLSAAVKAEPTLTYDSFFATLDTWLTPENVVVSDAGFPLLGAQNLHISSANGFVAQASWLAIGYSTPAAIGVKCASPDKRVVVVVGDGAFQETCQAVSSHRYLGHDTVVFVMANGIYGIEQKLVNPNPFRTPPVVYEDPLLNEVFPYNELHPWSYAKLAEAFGGQGRVVTTAGELSEVLAEIESRPDDNFVVEVRIPKVDIPSSARKSLANAGEDETANPSWPPGLLF